MLLARAVENEVHPVLDSVVNWLHDHYDARLADSDFITDNPDTYRIPERSKHG
jgi:uncharacterized protein (DUF885 family)